MKNEITLQRYTIELLIKALEQEQKLYNMIVIGIVQWNEMFNGVGVDVD